MTPADVARVLTALRADIDRTWQQRGALHGTSVLDDAVRHRMLATIDQRLWNISATSAFVERVNQEDK